MRLFSNFSGVCLLFSLWYFPANGQIGGTQHYGNRVILMGKWYQAGNTADSPLVQQRSIDITTTRWYRYSYNVNNKIIRSIIIN